MLYSSWGMSLSLNGYAVNPMVYNIGNRAIYLHIQQFCSGTQQAAQNWFLDYYQTNLLLKVYVA